MKSILWAMILITLSIDLTAETYYIAGSLLSPLNYQKTSTAREACGTLVGTPTGGITVGGSLYTQYYYLGGTDQCFAYVSDTDTWVEVPIVSDTIDCDSGYYLSYVAQKCVSESAGLVDIVSPYDSYQLLLVFFVAVSLLGGAFMGHMFARSGYRG